MFCVPYQVGRLTGLVTMLRKNCLLKHVIEEKIEGRIQMTERRRRKGKQLPDALKQTRG
jgi:hypothetical protein